MENSPIPVLEPQTSTSLDELDPDHILISRQQQERIRMDGCEVVASGSVLVPHESTIAIVPFPKSKTGFTIEIKIGSSPTPDGKAVSKSERQETTRTYRFNFLGYGAFCILPTFFATYRGHKVMGILNVTIAFEKPRIWSLNYTFFYAPKLARKH